MPTLPTITRNYYSCFRSLRWQVIFSLLFLLQNGFAQDKVGINTTSPTAGLHIVSDWGILATAEFGTGGLPATGYGTRIMWNPKTASFRSGRLTEADSGIYETWWDFFETGDYSFVSGVNSRAKGYASFATGDKNSAEGSWSMIAGGQSNVTLGNRSFATGYANTAYSLAESVIGMYAETYSASEINNYFGTDRIFVVGNGQHSGARSNALTILKNGNTGFGISTPLARMHVSGQSIIDNGRLSFINTGGSIFIGENSGGSFTGSNNIGIGYESMKNTSTGSSNVGVGFWSMLSNTSGGHNTAMGFSAMRSHTSGDNNVAIGSLAMNIAAAGTGNVALGFSAGTISSGDYNVFLGYQSGLTNSGSRNVFIGNESGAFELGSNKLYIDNSNTGTPLIYGDFSKNKVTINDSLSSKFLQLTEGAQNGYILKSDGDGDATWVSPDALGLTLWSANGNKIYNTNLDKVGIGTNNPQAPLHVIGKVIIDGSRLSFENTGSSILIGREAGITDDLTSNRNILIGESAGSQINNGTDNIAIGTDAMVQASNTSDNIAIGKSTMSSTAFSGYENIALGGEALRLNTVGFSNISIGYFALKNNSSGQHNIALGSGALLANTTGTENVVIGSGAFRVNDVTHGNVGVGRLVGETNIGQYNTMMGDRAGQYSNGSFNVFLGREAGRNANRSNSLYIDNSGSETPLIFGDFTNNRVFINDSLGTKYFTMTEGAVSGNVLVSDGIGNASWTDPALLSSSYWSDNAGSIYRNSNVGIGINSPTEKLHVAGNINVSNGRLIMHNGGLGTMVGHNAGVNDIIANLTACTFVGFQTGESNTTGGENTGLGAFALKANVGGSFNVAIGNGVLDSNTSGSFNTGLGYQALTSNITGANNTGIGMWSLLSSTGSYNTAVGHETGLALTSGAGNTFLGAGAGRNNTGSNNVFMGLNAGQNETGSNKLYIENSDTATPLIQGDFTNNKVIVNDSLTSKYFQMTEGATNGHVFVSDGNGNASWTDPALLNSSYWNASGGNIYRNSNVGINTNNPTAPLHTVGDVMIESGRIEFGNAGGSVFIGSQTGFNNEGDFNVFIGESAGYANTSGSNNIALGYIAMTNNTTGNDNLALGKNALVSNTTGAGNIGLGSFALGSNNGFSNVAIGSHALESNDSGDENLAFGFMAGFNSIGDGNIFLGSEAGHENTGNGSVFIGKQAGYNETGSNKLYIANSNTATPLIYGDFSTGHLTVNDSLTAKEYQVNGGRINFINSGQSVFIGEEAGQNDDLSDNHVVFIGYEAGKSNENGENNVAIGAFALDGSANVSNSIAIGKNVLGNASLSGNNNVGVGNFSLAANEGGNENTALGQSTLGASVSGDRNIAIGNYTMDANLTGDYNTAIGYEAFGESTDGEMNTGVGYYAGHYNTGIRNTFLGGSSGFVNTGSSNVFIGFESGYNESGSNRLHIANSGIGDPLIYGEFDNKKVVINDNLTVNEELSVGTSTANSTFEVNGSVAAKFKTPLIAGTNHPDDTGMVWRYNSGSGTITLPGAGTCPNRMYVIINQTGTPRTISSYRDLVTNIQTSLNSSVALWLMSDGNEWWQIK